MIVASVQEVVGTGLTRRVCNGWAGTGSVPSVGTNSVTRPFTLDRDSTLLWNWQTEHWVEGEVVGQGSIEGADQWVADGAVITLITHPADGWLFTGWSGEATGHREWTSLEVAVVAPCRYVAHFSEDADGDGLTNSEELLLGTNPWLDDTDGDGFCDGWEVSRNWNPLEPDNTLGDYIRTNAWRFGLMSTNVLAQIQQDPGAYGLIPIDRVADLDSGQISIAVSNNTIFLSLQIQASRNLSQWTNAGPPVIWSYPVGTNGPVFFRVQSRGL